MQRAGEVGAARCWPGTAGNCQGFESGACASPPLCAEPPHADPCSAPEQQKQAEGASLEQRAAQLATRLQELSAPGAPDARAVPALRQQLWDLEASAAEQQKELERQTAAVDHLEQVTRPLSGLGVPGMFLPTRVGRVGALERGATTGVLAFGPFSSTSGWNWR